MKWRGRRRSTNIEDRRGDGGGLANLRFPAGRSRTGGRRIRRRAGIGGVGIVIVVVGAVLLGVDPTQLLTQFQGPTVTAPNPYPPAQTPTSDPLRDFVAVVLADTEDIWHGLFRSQFDHSYQEPSLVLFKDGVRSACGFAGAAVGPFYCPGDWKLYLDLSFFDTLRERFRAPGDFAQAYVIAHEVGHHVQTLLGISERVREEQERLMPAEQNALSVRLELQADCFAGVWAHHADHAKGTLEQGDVEEALDAASAIGDDTLQRAARGTVVPDSFTHGSSVQRQRWFRRGLDDGRVESCDTFGAGSL